jgi:hypothetical protein
MKTVPYLEGASRLLAAILLNSNYDIPWKSTDFEETDSVDSVWIRNDKGEYSYVVRAALERKRFKLVRTFQERAIQHSLDLMDALMEKS